MPYSGPRFGPRGPSTMNPRFKQFPPHMQPRMHYGPRQNMKPRQPNSNNTNQPRPQNNENIKNNSVENKSIETSATNPIVKQEPPKTPQTQNMVKVEKPPVNDSLPQKQDINQTAIKVVTSNAHEDKPKQMNKPKINQSPTSVNANGNYSTQQKENQVQQSNTTDSRNYEQGNRGRNQGNYQQGGYQGNYQQGGHQGSYQQGGHQGNYQQGGHQGSYQQGGRQDYNKMPDYQNKQYFSNDRIRDRVRMISGPQLDLPPLDMSEKKFNSYSRLFVGNLQKNTSPEELEIVFSKYGEIGQTYVNKEASYAFINFDYKANALKAMKELDNTMIKGRAIKVRVATISDGIRVKNLSHTISNELLEKAFAVFGNVESCRIIVDDRGMPTGDGIVVFKDKKTAFLAVKKCQEECYILSGTARPVVVCPIEQSETNEEGLPEASLQKNDEYMRERSLGPHFAEEGSFEAELGKEWKKVYLVHEDRKKALDAEFQYDKERIEKKLVLARVEYEKEKLRKELAAREAESAHLRRHFEADQAPPNKPYPEGNEPLQYETYASSKRSSDVPAYDSAYAGSYDNAYKDSYDRSYGRDYDRGYGGRDYDRAAYAAYSNRDQAPYDRGYEMSPAELPPLEAAERPPKYDIPPIDPHYDVPEGYPAYDRQPAQEAYKPNKRPRY